MTKPAFIVEGYQEQKIIQSICNDCRVVRIDCNGKTVSWDYLALQIHEKCTYLGNRHHPIFVIFDREKRVESVEEIVSIVSKKLAKLQSNVESTFIFGIPDRKLESWILPFVGKDGKLLESPSAENEGSESLKQLVRRLRLNNIRYQKTSTGVSLFLNAVKPKKLAEVSPSFKVLFENGRDHCRWLKKPSI